MANLKRFDPTEALSKMSWQKPERRDQAGRVVIIGGFNSKLKDTNSVYSTTIASGVGSASVLVPESLARAFKIKSLDLVGLHLDHYFGLTDQGEQVLKEELHFADALIVTDTGSNSQTSLKLSKIVSDLLIPVTLSLESAPFLASHSPELLQNPRLTAILTLPTLQKVIKNLSLSVHKPILTTTQPNQKTELLAEVQAQLPTRLVLIDDGLVYCSDQDSYIRRDLNLSSQELAAKLTAWSIWTPTESVLARLSAALEA